VAISSIEEDLWCSHDIDLAILKLASAAPGELGFIQMGTGVVSAESVFAIGFPAGGAQFVSPGTVTEVENTYFAATSDIVGGFSGGPIVNSVGSLVGLTALGSFEGGVCTSHPNNFQAMLDASPTIRGQFVARIMAAVQL
jgi:S1-C subfamily serine protease